MRRSFAFTLATQGLVWNGFVRRANPAKQAHVVAPWSNLDFFGSGIGLVACLLF